MKSIQKINFFNERTYKNKIQHKYRDLLKIMEIVYLLDKNNSIIFATKFILFVNLIFIMTCISNTI